MNYHIGRLVLSSLCVGAFVAAGFGWCSFCRLQPAKETQTGHRRPKFCVFSHCTVCRISGSGVFLVRKVFSLQGFYISVTSRGLFCLWLMTFCGICLLGGIIIRFLDLNIMRGFLYYVLMKEITYCPNLKVNAW